ncbi:PIN domain-containing protein [Spirosoma endophyticum]|uniref:PIN domain-containing protein n=1 Tax=Spirosoma endophyticum TaxID=662367 RepID=A0A1I1ZCG0_9BACT|nr:PIN domain-containing protein [Spirosoma endophyticum]SFE29441.1 PIN domain-containing protein [Spirosoma endophyticum]
MKPTIVVDANILMSALITQQGRVAATLIEASDRYRFISCHFLYIELFKHKEKMVKLSRLSEADFLELLLGLLNRIEFLNESLLPASAIEQARQLVYDVDPRDSHYVALALQYKARLWTGDRKLSEGLQAKGVTFLCTTADL